MNWQRVCIVPKSDLEKELERTKALFAPFGSPVESIEAVHPKIEVRGKHGYKVSEKAYQIQVLDEIYSEFVNQEKELEKNGWVCSSQLTSSQLEDKRKIILERYGKILVYDGRNKFTGRIDNTFKRIYLNIERRNTYRNQICKGIDFSKMANGMKESLVENISAIVESEQKEEKTKNFLSLVPKN